MNATIRCLIIEDEPLAAEVLADYVAAVPQLDLVEICPDALYALEVLRNKPIDLLFLDIHLPKLKGLDFLATLADPPQVILTTAYHQYALEGYTYNVVDYLLKPIAFQRFVQAVNKVAAPTPPTSPVPVLEDATPPYQFVNVNKRAVKVILSDILYIESLKEYAHIHLIDQTIITKAQLGELQLRFSSKHLLRVHRSFLIAKDKITAFSSTDIEIGNTSIPIGRSYKQQVLDILKEL